MDALRRSGEAEVKPPAGRQTAPGSIASQAHAVET